MRHLLFLLLAGLALAADAHAADTDVVALPGATIVASPACPSGLQAFLPDRRPPAPLALPLPDGPLLILGLPDEDPVAAGLASAWGILPPDGDLHGGYVRVAWHDGHRPIAVILGADAAALYAARFELAAAAAGPPSTDFTKPPPEGALLLRRGWHHVRPRFRVRAVFPDRRSVETLLPELVAGHANQVWIDEQRDVDGVAAKLLPKLARYGIVPVLLVRPTDASRARIPLADRVAPWREKAGIRRFALLIPHTPGQMCPPTAATAREAVDALRAGGPVAQVFVTPRMFDVPGATRTWGRRRRPLDAARRALRAAGGDPVFFWEPWAAGSRTPVPSRPRGRALGLGDVLDGIVIQEGPGLEAILRDAWAGTTDEPEAWETHLLPLLPRGPQDARAFLVETRSRLVRAAKKTMDAVPWMGLLAKQIGADLEHVPETALLVPRVPAPITADGHLDEPAWAWATRFDVERVDGTKLELLAVADGRGLALAIRGPADTEVALFRIRAAEPGSAGTLLGGGVDAATPEGRSVWRRSRDGVTWEGVLDHFALRGDAHPARTFVLETFGRDPTTRKITERHAATLVLGP